MGDSNSGVGVMPGVDSIFRQLGVGFGTGVKYFFMTGVGTGVGVKPLVWSRSRSQAFFTTGVGTEVDSGSDSS